MKRYMLSLAALFIFFITCAQTPVHFVDTEQWTANQLQPYVGQTVVFDQPVYTCNNYNGTITASLHRVWSPTNQALPLSAEYNSIVSVNQKATFNISGLASDRMGQIIYGLKAKINSTSSISVLSYDSIWGTREDMLKGIPNLSFTDSTGNVIKPDIIVCGANLEYYLVENLGTGYGPSNAAQHAAQRNKVKTALAQIKADIFGLVEVEQGQSAIAEIAADLTALTGRHYTYINDGGRASGSYTKSCYVYCSDVVTPVGKLTQVVEAGAGPRKYMQAFKLLKGEAAGETFIYSINHFKAKSGDGPGQDADQGDGQGKYNYSRTLESKAVLSKYRSIKNSLDQDILIMGDLNAYGMEDPITMLKDGGMIDLHRYFHNNASYSYTYHGQAGYLDHALCNETLLPQVTGMAAYHINSDENDDYTYNGRRPDASMFRYSDHDPVLVGLKLGAKLPIQNPKQEKERRTMEDVELHFLSGQPIIQKANGGLYTIYDMNGQRMRRHTDTPITSDSYVVEETLSPGFYIIRIYANGSYKSFKYFVR